MESNLTAKFFKVSRTQGAPEFIDALATIAQRPLPERQLDINPDSPANPVIVRLERLDTSNSDFVIGELIRKQTRDIPPEVNDDGLQAVVLSNGGGLGYSSVFVFHRPTSVILIQANQQAVTSSRLARYLGLSDPTAMYGFDNVPTEGAWSRFNSGVPRKLRVRLANPRQLSGLTGPAQSVAEAAANLAEATNGAYITFEVSMGSQRGTLVESWIRQAISGFRRVIDDSGSDIVRDLSASVKPEGEETDVIDFLDEFLTYRGVLELPENDHEISYQRRYRALLTEFRERLEYITRLYGAS